MASACSLANNIWLFVTIYSIHTPIVIAAIHTWYTYTFIRALRMGAKAWFTGWHKEGSQHTCTWQERWNHASPSEWVYGRSLIIVIIAEVNPPRYSERTVAISFGSKALAISFAAISLQEECGASAQLDCVPSVLVICGEVHKISAHTRVAFDEGMLDGNNGLSNALKEFTC